MYNHIGLALMFVKINHERAMLMFVYALLMFMYPMFIFVYAWFIIVYAMPMIVPRKGRFVFMQCD